MLTSVNPDYPIALRQLCYLPSLPNTVVVACCLFPSLWNNRGEDANQLRGQSFARLGSKERGEDPL